MIDCGVPIPLMLLVVSRNISGTLCLEVVLESCLSNQPGAEIVAVQYERAPITEALIDIRVQVPDVFNTVALERVYDLVRDHYPVKQKRLFLVEGRISAGDEVGASATQKPWGFAFVSEDAKQVFQARLDGFTFSRLRPYGTWNDLRDEARRLWGLYRSVSNPPKILRVAVRYINQIDIPQSGIEYKDYFRTVPEVSPDLPQRLSGFFMQLQFPQDDFGGQLVLTQTAITPATPSTTSVILDLDVSKDGADIATDDEAWRLLEILRNRKNEFFEGCITDRARQLFGQRREY
jgi:uncharacterized protein (TIGR04255 family)